MNHNQISNDPVLARFRAAVSGAYGSRIECMVLFGSRARGDECSDSDHDVAVFLRDMSDRMAEMNKLAAPSTSILYETGEFIHAMPYHAASYQR